MPFEAKLAVFWLLVFGLLRWLHRNPTSLAAKLAFSWHGPFPSVGERKSQYRIRQALFALGWLSQFLAVLSVGYLLAWRWPEFSDTTAFLLVFAFAMPIAAGMALLGALVAGLLAVWAVVRGCDPAFGQSTGSADA